MEIQYNIYSGFKFEVILNKREKTEKLMLVYEGVSGTTNTEWSFLDRATGYIYPGIIIDKSSRPGPYVSTEQFVEILKKYTNLSGSTRALLISRDININITNIENEEK